MNNGFFGLFVNVLDVRSIVVRALFWYALYIMGNESKIVKYEHGHRSLICRID